jgi:heme-binding protein
MKRVPAKWIVLGVIAVLLLIQLIQPSRTNPPVVASRSLAAHMAVPPDVDAVLKRGCYDCHSSETVWPWYSHVAPVSWYVAHDVNVARSHVNFQDWEAQENPKEALEHLGLTCKLMREGKMPPADYLTMHKNANVSQADIETVCAWTQKVVPADDADSAGHDHDHHDHEHPDKD